MAQQQLGGREEENVLAVGLGQGEPKVQGKTSQSHSSETPISSRTEPVKGWLDAHTRQVWPIGNPADLNGYIGFCVAV